MIPTSTRHALGPLDQIPVGEARVFHIDGQHVAIFRCRSGEVFAASAECPHRGGPLADGLIGKHSVICPLHGILFDLRTGEATGRDCAPLTTHRISVAEGHVTVELT